MALANLTTETQADRTSFAMLTKTIAELSTQVTTLTAKLATAKAENACLKRSRNFSANAGDPDNQVYRSVTVGPPSDQNLLRNRNIYSRSGKSLTPTGIAHLTGLRSRNPILPQLAATSLMETKNGRRGWIPREEKYGTKIGSRAGQLSG